MNKEKSNLFRSVSFDLGVVIFFLRRGALNAPPPMADRVKHPSVCSSDLQIQENEG